MILYKITSYKLNSMLEKTDHVFFVFADSVGSALNKACNHLLEVKKKRIEKAPHLSKRHVKEFLERVTFEKQVRLIKNVEQVVTSNQIINYDEIKTGETE